MKIIQVGCGYWGESWLQFIAEDPQAELAALVSNRESDLEMAKEKHGLAAGQCFMDYEEALQKAEADLVLIVVPHGSHISFAKKAVSAGKDVLIEKPLCDDLEEAKEFAQWMRGRKERVFVSHNYRYRQELWQMKKGVSGGDLGSLQFVQLTYRAGLTTDPKEHEWNIQGWRGQQVNMLCYEICIHHFDMLRFLAGSNVRRLYCSGWTPRWGLTKGPESIFVNLEFENGVHALVSAHSCSVGGQTEFQGNWQVQGAKGLVKWISGEGLKIDPAADHPGRLPKPEETGFPGFDRAGVLSELHRALSGKPSTLPTLEDNLQTLAISTAALLSAKERRAVELKELL